MLKSDFVPVAIDQAYQRRQKDAEGEFYQSIAKQGPRNDMSQTTQGHYVCDASGKLLGYNNNRHVEPLKKIMKKVVAEFEPAVSAEKLDGENVDQQYDRTLPDGVVVVQVNSKILGGYDKPKNNNVAIFQRAISRDNLWILKNEKAELAKGNFPESLAWRIAQFHLIDNTRGEPQMWKKDEIKSVDVKMDSEGNVTGSVVIESADTKRGYATAIAGKIKAGDSIETFDLVAKGKCYGNGLYTSLGPEGKFPLAIAFRIADENDLAFSVSPQGSKGWLGGYLKTPGPGLND